MWSPLTSHVSAIWVEISPNLDVKISVEPCVWRRSSCLIKSSVAKKGAATSADEPKSWWYEYSLIKHLKKGCSVSILVYVVVCLMQNTTNSYIEGSCLGWLWRKSNGFLSPSYTRIVMGRSRRTTHKGRTAAMEKAKKGLECGKWNALLFLDKLPNMSRIQKNQNSWVFLL